MPDFLKHPWPWYVAGPLIGLTVPYLLLVGNKTLGISSALRHICAAWVPANLSFFKYDWKREAWNLFFVGGIAVGALLATTFLADPAPLRVAPATAERLAAQGITDTTALLPSEIWSWSHLASLRGLVFLVVGGFLVGFGTRYAGGCTSGHAIMGLSNLQGPSLIATCCFLAGGYATTWLLLPHLLAL